MRSPQDLKKPSSMPPKPHPLIFRKTLGELRIRASEAIHVGDLFESDVVGAKVVGMQTVWFNKENKVHRDKGTKSSPDCQIGSLSAVVRNSREVKF